MFKQLTTAIVLASSFVALAASAADIEIVSYPGGNCTTADGSPAAGSVVWEGAMINRSTASHASVYCPLYTSSITPGVKEVQFRFLDRNSTAGNDTKCAVNTQYYNAAGVLLGWSSEEVSGGSPYSATVMPSARVPWGPLTIGMNSNLRCRVPAKTALGVSGIFSYDVIR